VCKRIKIQETDQEIPQWSILMDGKRRRPMKNGKACAFLMDIRLSRFAWVAPSFGSRRRADEPAGIDEKLP
jgi:hypothetical protein